MHYLNLHHNSFEQKVLYAYLKALQPYSGQCDQPKKGRETVSRSRAKRERPSEKQIYEIGRLDFQHLQWKATGELYQVFKMVHPCLNRSLLNTCKSRSGMKSNCRIGRVSICNAEVIEASTSGPTKLRGTGPGWILWSYLYSFRRRGANRRRNALLWQAN